MSALFPIVLWTRAQPIHYLFHSYNNTINHWLSNIKVYVQWNYKNVTLTERIIVSVMLFAFYYNFESQNLKLLAQSVIHWMCDRILVLFHTNTYQLLLVKVSWWKFWVWNVLLRTQTTSAISVTMRANDEPLRLSSLIYTIFWSYIHFLKVMWLFYWNVFCEKSTQNKQTTLKQSCTVYVTFVE